MNRITLTLTVALLALLAPRNVGVTAGAGVTVPPPVCPVPHLVGGSGHGYPRAVTFGVQVPLYIGWFQASNRTGRIFITRRADRPAGCPAAVFALDAASSRVIASRSLTDDALWVGLDDRHGRLVVETQPIQQTADGSAPAHIILLDIRTLSVAAEVPLSDGAGPLLLVPGARRVLVQSGERLRSLDVMTGRFGPDSDASLSGSQTVDEWNAAVYTLTGTGRLAEVDARTGREVWARQYSGCGGSLLYVGWSRRIFTSRGGYPGSYRYPGRPGHVCVIDAATHRLISRESMGGVGGVRLQAGDRQAGGIVTIYYADDCPIGAPCMPSYTGPLWMLRAADGRLLHQVDLDAAWAVVDRASGRLYVLTGDGARKDVQVIDPRTWKRTVLARGVEATSLVLANRGTRLWVLNGPQATASVLCAVSSC